MLVQEETTTEIEWHFYMEREAITEGKGGSVGSKKTFERRRTDVFSATFKSLTL